MSYDWNALKTQCVAWIARKVAQLDDSRARSRTRRALETVDAATLRDIGLSRAELMSVCMGDSAGRRRSHG